MERHFGPLLRLRLLLILAIAAPFAWFFGAVLFAPRSFVFRDAAHYYYPLFQWTAREWSSGQVPLWNPQENAGVPVLADATSSVFYPGKLLFLLPLDYATKYNAYVVLHVLLAAWGAYRLARHWKASPPAAVLAALSYAFSGAVLFQYCNVVFLVGAGWLPLAVRAADRMLIARRLGDSLVVAVVWSLMVLGGDPQAAYHAGLLAVLLAGLRWREGKRSALRTDASRDGRGVDARSPPVGDAPWWGNPLLLLAVAALVAALLSAVQILPSAEWSAHSERAVYESPRSVYEVPGFLARPAEARGEGSVAAGLFGSPDRGRHHEQIYQFSVAPWHLPELIWPNFSGRLFPIHRRWMTAIPAEGRIWTPSLYLGLIPLLLALAHCRWRGVPVPVRWAICTVLAGMLGSFGWYGIGWVVHEVRSAMGGAVPDRAWLGQPVGGLYWMMVVLLPGYAMFRFPAKLFVVATLGLSLLAAWGFDGIGRTRPRRLQRLAVGTTVASLLLAGATLLAGPWWAWWLRDVPRDALFGPFDAAGSLADLRGTLLHTAFFGAALVGLLRIAGGRYRRAVPALLLALTAMDLAVAHRWLIPTAPLNLWQRPGYYAREILDHSGEAGRSSTLRIHRGARQSWLPEPWARYASPDRQREGLRWDVDTMFPKHHLPSGLALVQSFGTFSSSEFSATMRIARRRGWQRPDGVREPHPGVLDALGARYLLLPADAEYPHGQRLVREGSAPPNSSLWFNPQALPRAWIVDRVQTLPPLELRTPQSLEQRTREVWFPNGRPRDMRREAVVEADDAVAARLGGAVREPAGGPEDNGSCRITLAASQRVDLEVYLPSPGLVVLSDLYYPGWVATLRSDDGSRPRAVPILRTNRIMRGVWLPAGNHHLSFTYRPRGFYTGAAVSALAWLAIAVQALRRPLHRRRLDSTRPRWPQLI